MIQLKVSQVADASAVVASTNYPFIADWQKVVTVHAIWTSTTASATLTLQQSLDNANWADFTTATSIANNAGNVMWNVDTKDALYWRVLLTYTSGSVTTLKVFVANTPR